MAKRAVICVGVNRAGTMTPLDAAVKGARDVEAWAMAQECATVVLVDDDPNAKVSLNDIFDAVKQVVDSNTYDQLIIYFSGHGILTAPSTEYWLLSRAPDNPNEAVNLYRSIENARNSGIPHVVFVSDACRSNVAPPLNAVTGGVIFSILPVPPQRSEVDVYYATYPGDPAYEVPEAEATQRFRGIFTDCLLRVLKSPPHDMVESLSNSGPPLTVVTSRKLKPYLESTVPVDAASVDIQLRQKPEIHVETAFPKFFASIAAGATVRPPAPTPTPTLNAAFAALSATYFRQDAVAPDQASADLAAALGLNAEVDYLTAGPKASKTLGYSSPIWEQNYSIGWEQIKGRWKARQLFGNITNDELDAIEGKRDELVGKLQVIYGYTKEKAEQEARRGHTGFTVRGASVVAAHALRWQADLDAYPGGLPFADVQLNPKEPNAERHPSSFILEFVGGTGTSLAVLPEFIGTVTVENRRVISVSYVPSDQSWRYRLYAKRAKQLEAMKAFAAVASRNGSFFIENERADTLADRIRQGKGIDPTMGLYAAYAYAQVGRYDDVYSIFTYMKDDIELPVPFDVVMLAARHRADAPNDSDVHLAPFAPMFTQGWALLMPGDAMHHPIHERLRPHLVPSLWTTFDAIGVSIAREALMNGEVI